MAESDSRVGESLVDDPFGLGHKHYFANRDYLDWRDEDAPEDPDDELVDDPSVASMIGFDPLELESGSTRMAAARAPAGYTNENPLVINGQQYIGGEFIPGVSQAEVDSAANAQTLPGGRSKISIDDKIELEKDGPTGLYSEADERKFRELKSEWSKINNSMLEYVDRPDSPEAKAGLEKMKEIVKQIHRLHADKGDWSGLGKPGGPRDVVVIGAGPGGLASAIMGATDGLDTLVIEANTKVGGQSKYSSRIENFPGFPLGVTGASLAQKMHQQAERLGAQSMLGVRVVGLTNDPKTNMKTIELSNGEKIQSRSVIIAGGLEFRKLEFKGSDSERVCYGDAERVQKICENKPAVIVGGSNGAAQAALGVARSADHVYLLSRSPIVKKMSDYQVQALKAHPKITVVEGDVVKEFTGDVVNTMGGKQLPAYGIGVFAGSMPGTGWLPEGVERERGKIKVNNSMESTVPGVFAIGDNRVGAIGRVGAAVGDGQFAAHGVFGYFERAQKQQEEE